MSNAILDAIKVLNQDATTASLQAACQQLVENSEIVGVYQHPIPFTDDDCDAIAEGILQYIADPRENSDRAIVFADDRAPFGEFITCGHLAEGYSKEFLDGYELTNWEAIDAVNDGVPMVIEYCIALIFKDS